MSHNKIVSDTLFFTFANYCGQFLAMVRGVVVAKFLSPTVYGYFGGLSLIQFYSAQGHLGILHGLNRELSIKKGANDLDGYDEIKNTSFCSILLLAVLLSLGVLLYAQVTDQYYSKYMVWGMRFFGLAIMLQHLEMVYHSILRAEHRINLISISRLLFAFANILLVIILLPFWGFYGVLVALLAASALSCLFLIGKSRLKFSFQINRALVISLMKTGLPISFMFLVEVILTSVDRVMIIRYLDTAQLGYYSIAVTICEALSRLPNAVVYTYFPKILEKYGETGEIASLKNHFELPSLILGVSVAFFIGIAFLLIGILIANFLPAYREAIVPSKVLLFSVFFMALGQMANRVLIAIKKNRLVIFLQISVIFLSIALNYIFIKSGYGILGVAMGTTISYCLYAIGILSYTFSQFYKIDFQLFKKQFVIYSPIVVCFLLLRFIQTNFICDPLAKGLLPDLNLIVAPLALFTGSFLLVSYLLMLRYRAHFSALLFKKT